MTRQEFLDLLIDWWPLIKTKRCHTGRVWVQCGDVHVGFGPNGFIERIQYQGKHIYVDEEAALAHREEVTAYQKAKDERQAMERGQHEQ